MRMKMIMRMGMSFFILILILILIPILILILILIYIDILVALFFIDFFFTFCLATFCFKNKPLVGTILYFTYHFFISIIFDGKFNDFKYFKVSNQLCVPLLISSKKNKTLNNTFKQVLKLKILSVIS